MRQVYHANRKWHMIFSSVLGGILVLIMIFAKIYLLALILFIFYAEDAIGYWFKNLIIEDGNLISTEEWFGKFDIKSVKIEEIVKISRGQVNVVFAPFLEVLTRDGQRRLHFGGFYFKSKVVGQVLRELQKENPEIEFDAYAEKFLKLDSHVNQ